MKNIIGIYTSPRGHWVGDGFPVRTLFSYDNLGKHISPFLLLDHAGPAEFTPTTEQRGVGQHPHRGFETVTIVYDGEVQHRDSTGSGGTIGPGDVQWMTAASGILHEEFHSENFAVVNDGHGFEPTVRVLADATLFCGRGEFGGSGVIEQQKRADVLTQVVVGKQRAHRETIADPMAARAGVDADDVFHGVSNVSLHWIQPKGISNIRLEGENRP